VSRHAAAQLARLPLASLRGDALVDAVYGALAEAKRLDAADEAARRQQPGGARASPAEGAAAYADVARALAQQLLGLWWGAAQGRLRAELGLPGGGRGQATPAAVAAPAAAKEAGGRERRDAQPPPAAAKPAAPKAAAAPPAAPATAKQKREEGKDEEEDEGEASGLPGSASSSGSDSDEEPFGDGDARGGSRGSHKQPR
jgi:hypothetical protein